MDSAPEAEEAFDIVNCEVCRFPANSRFGIRELVDFLTHGMQEHVGTNMAPKGLTGVIFREGGESAAQVSKDGVGKLTDLRYDGLADFASKQQLREGGGDEQGSGAASRCGEQNAGDEKQADIVADKEAPMADEDDEGAELVDKGRGTD